MRDYVQVKTQAELDRAVADGNIPVCRAGVYVASGSATVEAYGSATVRASGSATVEAYGSATVEASGSATVEAYDSATVRASPYVAVHRHGCTANITGGVLIQVPPVSTVQEWADFHGLKVSRGKVTVFKAVREDLRSRSGGDYSGKTAEAADWKPVPSCGNGLHFSQSPHHARRYDMDATRFLACEVKLADAVLIGEGAHVDKIKARACRVVGEVTVDGVPVPPVAKAA